MSDLNEPEEFPPDELSPDTDEDAGPASTEHPPRPLRRMILRSTAALPALVTLMNGAAGFASIHYATKDGLTAPESVDLAAAWHLTVSAHLAVAAWLIFAAMVADALDGRLARMTRQATDFGAQLDSLCDAISFGVAPAVLMVHTVSTALAEQIRPFDIFQPEGSILSRLVMAIAVVYMSCAILRLARFNIENAPDVLHHMRFKGLPSPAAAATVASLVLLFNYLEAEPTWKSAAWLKVSAGATLPAVTLAVALMMISRFEYPHVVNRLATGRWSMRFIVAVLGAIALMLVHLRLTLSVVTLAFAASGPVIAVIRKVRHRPPPIA